MARVFGVIGIFFALYGMGLMSSGFYNLEWKEFVGGGGIIFWSIFFIVVVGIQCPHDEEDIKNGAY